MIGKSVRHYYILGTVGSGGTSIVYKARDTKLGRIVALKFLLPEFCSDRQALKQFHREARHASAVNHPAICTIHDIHMDGRRPFIVMEFLEGATLRDTLRTRGLKIGEAVFFAAQITDALGHAHAKRIVHRDITPRNVFITDEGRIKLLDFGIAKYQPLRVRTRSSARGKNRSVLTGTLHYMSPEQVLGREVDARSDIFSTGVVLYEMLTGQRPFVARSISEIFSQMLHTQPRAVRDVNPEVPVEIECIVKRCLRKWPNERYQSAAELHRDLTAAAAALPEMQRLVQSRCNEQGPGSWTKTSLSFAKTLPSALATLHSLPTM